MRSPPVLTALVVATLWTLPLWLGACSERVTSVESVFDRLEAPPSEPGEVATFALVQERVLTPGCAITGCHNGAVFPDLSAPGAYDNLVGRPSSAGMPLVDPGSPATSYLYVKVKGGPGLSGSIMPLGAPAVAPTLIDSLAAWIERGAPRDE